MDNVFEENDKVARDKSRKDHEQTSPVAEHAFDLGWDAARRFYVDDCDDCCCGDCDDCDDDCADSCKP